MALGGVAERRNERKKRGHCSRPLKRKLCYTSMQSCSVPFFLFSSFECLCRYNHFVLLCAQKMQQHTFYAKLFFPLLAHHCVYKKNKKFLPLDPSTIRNPQNEKPRRKNWQTSCLVLFFSLHDVCVPTTESSFLFVSLFNKKSAFFCVSFLLDRKRRSEQRSVSPF